MNESWRLTTWGSVCDLKYGKALSGYRESTGNTEVFGTNGPVGWTTAEPLGHGPRPIVGRKGAYRGIHLASGDFWVIDTAYWLEPTADLDPTWAYHALLLVDINGMDSGSAIPSLTRDHFRAAPLLLPPLDEQRRIAGVLGALDDLIEVNRQLMKQILSLSRALWSAAVDPSTRRIRLDTIAEVNPSRAKRPDDSDVIYLAIADVKDGSIAWPAPTIWSETPAAARLLTQKGDVIWSRVRPNRRSHALLPATNSPIVVSTGMVVLRPKGVSPSYLMAACDNEGFADRLTAIAGGTAYPTVDADDFSSVEVPLMSEGQRRKFDATMTPLWDVFGALEDEIRELSEIRDEMLPLLMSGRVRVGDAAA